ncbi:MAG: hypothetical protein COA52_17380 [Hyphomicrobiales bacterium]|nr:MAG: hypothetical protein COA52_17380 [Hyphomicrobiales bacterium]
MSQKHSKYQIVQGDEFYDRANGKVAFSRRSAVIADNRMKATNGRVDKILGTDDTFSQSFKNAINDDYNHILEQVYLTKELTNYKKVINALRQRPDDAECKKLLQKTRRNPTRFRGSNVLCPIWKNNRINDLTHAAIPRYLFPEKSNELYLLTIIFDFAENLYQLEELIEAQHIAMNDLISALTKKKRGIFIAGCFEPDLKSHEQLTDPTSGSAKLLKHLEITAPDTGGWILTGHFIIRAPNNDWIYDELDSQYPGSSWRRVQFNNLHASKTLAQHMMEIIGYAAKYPKPLFNYDTRGCNKEAGNALMDSMQSAFYGPSLPFDADTVGFGVDDAIRQWALFMNRLGEGKLFYAKESSYAQKWYSQSEWNSIRKYDRDLFQRNGETINKIELHRDTEFYSDKIKSNLKGRCRFLRTRNIRYDEEWHYKTDVGEGDGPVSYDGWIGKSA